jgi:hypothetical protein
VKKEPMPQVVTLVEPVEALVGLVVVVVVAEVAVEPMTLVLVERKNLPQMPVLPRRQRVTRLRLWFQELRIF